MKAGSNWIILNPSAGLLPSFSLKKKLSSLAQFNSKVRSKLVDFPMPNSLPDCQSITLQLTYSQKERIVFQASIFRCKLLVSERVTSKYVQTSPGFLVNDTTTSMSQHFLERNLLQTSPHPERSTTQGHPGANDDIVEWNLWTTHVRCRYCFCCPPGCMRSIRILNHDSKLSLCEYEILVGFSREWTCVMIPIRSLRLWSVRSVTQFLYICILSILLIEEIPNNHLGCMKPCKKWDKLPTSTG